MCSLLGFLLLGGVLRTLSIWTNSLPPDLISLQSEAIFLHRYKSWPLTPEVRFSCPVFVSLCFPKSALLMIKLPAAPCSHHISVHWSQNLKDRNDFQLPQFIVICCSLCPKSYAGMSIVIDWNIAYVAAHHIAYQIIKVKVHVDKLFLWI